MSRKGKSVKGGIANIGLKRKQRGFVFGKLSKRRATQHGYKYHVLLVVLWI